MKDIKSCYIHIPFCNSICSYCDFCKVFYNEKLVDKYLDALEYEIDNIYNDECLNTLYIGGGTPSSLNIKQLDRLFMILKKIKLNNNYEYTIECNFNSIDINKLELFKKYGINRLSFGIESISKNNLKLLERIENKDTITNTIKMCKDLGFNNINVDLMYAIPGEDLNCLNNDLDFVLSLDIEHISTYSLIIEKNTKLYINNIKNISEEEDYLMYKKILEKLKLNGYNHYEISNFSKNNYESRHNLCYWNNNNYYGFGLGASSYINDERITNTRSINKYLNKDFNRVIEKITTYDKMSYEMILGLRLIKGVNKKNFFNKYNKQVEEVFDINKLIKDSLLIDDGDNIYIPEDKIYISNEILINFVKE